MARFLSRARRFFSIREARVLHNMMSATFDRVARREKFRSIHHPPLADSDEAAEISKIAPTRDC